MNFCADCDSALSASAKFCSSCGTATEGTHVITPVVTGKKSRKKLLVGAAAALLVLGGGTAVALIRHGGTDPGQAAYDACMAAGEKSHAECSLLLKRNADDVANLQSDTEGYSEQPKTCLEWRTNYKSQYVGGAGLQQGYDQFGQSVLTSPPGHWEQVPSGQTCVRYG